MFPTIHNSAYVITSPYTSVQVPVAASRPLPLAPTFFYEPNRAAFIQTPTMMYTSMVDSYLNQKNDSVCVTKIEKDESAKECVKYHQPFHVAAPAFIHPSPHVVYTSIAGELITHQSLLNSEKKIDEKINETVQSHIKKYEMEKLREEDIKNRLAEHEANKLIHECHNSHSHHHDEHHHEKHEHTEHHDHHHHHVCERTQGSQTSFADLDKKCCCCSSDHKLPVCNNCVNSHYDCCLEKKITFTFS